MLFSVFYKVYLKGEKITDTDGYVQGWSGLGGILHPVSVERVPPLPVTSLLTTMGEKSGCLISPPGPK